MPASLRLLLAAVLLSSLMHVPASAAPEPIQFEVTNPFAFDRGQTLVSRKVEITTSGFWLKGADGKALASWYDKADKRLWFMDTFKAGETRKYTLLLSAGSKPKLPAWKPAKIDKSKKIPVGKGETATTASCELNNGLVNVIVGRDGGWRAQVDIMALDGKRKLTLAPMGSCTNNIPEAKIAQEIEDIMKKGGDTHPALFWAGFGYPVRIKVDETNPFKRVIDCECLAVDVKGDTTPLDHVSKGRLRVELIWGSPIVTLHCERKVDKTFYNHNGVFIHSIRIPKFPVRLTIDDAEARDVPADTKPVKDDLGLQKAMLLEMGKANGDGRFAIALPEFRKLGIDGARFCAGNDQLLSCIAQTWGQGWKPVEIKAGDYNDRVLVAAETAEWEKQHGARKLADWVSELEAPVIASEETK